MDDYFFMVGVLWLGIGIMFGFVLGVAVSAAGERDKAKEKSNGK